MKRTRHRKRLRKTKTQKRRNTRRIKRAGSGSKTSSYFRRVFTPQNLRNLASKLKTETVKDLFERGSKEALKQARKLTPGTSGRKLQQSISRIEHGMKGTKLQF
jgi:hypothetical protein